MQSKFSNKAGAKGARRTSKPKSGPRHSAKKSSRPADFSEKIEKTRITQQVIRFPAAWNKWIEEIIPAYTKETYSPKENWKKKPFSRDDAHFFFRGIDDLSDLFTEDRPAHLPNYFLHPKYRSAYLLYFLPFQAAKFISAFQLHRPAFEAALDHGKKTGSIKLADLGAGPGTATIAFLLWLLDQRLKEFPKVEADWFDMNRSIMEDGKKIVDKLVEAYPQMKDKVEIRLHASLWAKAPKILPESLSLVLMGNVLNETVISSQTQQTWLDLLEKSSGGGVLILEPAARRPSQLLSRLRDEFLEIGAMAPFSSSIWGPCLHAGRCPFAEGRDWCHFSVPARIPGQWFAEFSKGLGSERQWLKYSYLWIASRDYPAPEASRDLRRVISDPLDRGGPTATQETVLICEPETPRKIRVPARRVHRGDVYEYRAKSQK